MTTIYITHGHGDHFFGLAHLLKRFPEAKAVGTEATVRYMHSQIDSAFFEEFWGKRFPGQITQPLVVADVLQTRVIDLEGHELVPVEVGQSDTHDTTVLHVPDLDLVVAGDVAYNDVHLYLSESTKERRKDWIASIVKLAALQPRLVVAGHKRLGAIDAAYILAETKQYIEDFDGILERAPNPESLVETMLQAHPTRVNTDPLFNSARAVFAAGKTCSARFLRRMEMIMENSSNLKWDVLAIKRPGLGRDVPPGKEDLMWVTNTSTLIYGEKDAVLVDTFLTSDQATTLVDWVVKSGKTLTAIYVTHGHGDHFFGLASLLKQFPNARAFATPEVVKAMEVQLSPKWLDDFWRKLFPGQIPNDLPIAQPLVGNVLQLEGHKLVCFDAGRTDTAVSTCLHVPSIGVIVGGDAVYNGSFEAGIDDGSYSFGADEMGTSSHAVACYFGKVRSGPVAFEGLAPRAQPLPAQHEGSAVMTIRERR